MGFVTPKKTQGTQGNIIKVLANWKFLSFFPISCQKFLVEFLKLKPLSLPGSTSVSLLLLSLFALCCLQSCSHICILKPALWPLLTSPKVMLRHWVGPCLLLCLAAPFNYLFQQSSHFFFIYPEHHPCFYTNLPYSYTLATTNLM